MRPPADVAAIAAAGPDVPVSFVFTRLRTRPTDRWRSTPSRRSSATLRCRASARSTPQSRSASTSGPDDVLAEPCSASRVARRPARLTGVASAAGWAATDGDPATSWITPFGGAVGGSRSPRTGGRT